MGYLARKFLNGLFTTALILFICGIHTHNASGEKPGANHKSDNKADNKAGTQPGVRITDQVSLAENRLDVKKGEVAFVEIRSQEPSTIYIMYPTQYNKYKTTGSLEGVLEHKNVTWLIHPVPAMLEDQTVYFIQKGETIFSVVYENIQERIDGLIKGEEMLRAGMEMRVADKENVVRLTPLIPDLKMMLDFSKEAKFVIIKTIDFARYRKGLKNFDQLYEESVHKGSGTGYNFTTKDFEDLYLIIKTPDPIRVKYIIRATKESAESGC